MISRLPLSLKDILRTWPLDHFLASTRTLGKVIKYCPSLVCCSLTIMKLTIEQIINTGYTNTKCIISIRIERKNNLFVLSFYIHNPS
jgi:hypothetical protein